MTTHQREDMIAERSRRRRLVVKDTSADNISAA
jgi:hypothetical protein